MFYLTAYQEAYGDEPVWAPYRRNFKGQFPPETRKKCIVGCKVVILLLKLVIYTAQIGYLYCSNWLFVLLKLAVCTAQIGYYLYFSNLLFTGYSAQIGHLYC